MDTRDPNHVLLVVVLIQGAQNVVVHRTSGRLALAELVQLLLQLVHSLLVKGDLLQVFTFFFPELWS